MEMWLVDVRSVTVTVKDQDPHNVTPLQDSVSVRKASLDYIVMCVKRAIST